MITEPNPTQEYKPIEDIVCARYGITHEHLHSRDRHQQIAAARQVIFYLVRNIFGHTFQRMGKVYKRDHTTFCYSRKAVEELRSVDKAFSDSVRNLEAECRKALNL